MANKDLIEVVSIDRDNVMYAEKQAVGIELNTVSVVISLATRRCAAQPDANIIVDF